MSDKTCFYGDTGKVTVNMPLIIHLIWASVELRNLWTAKYCKTLKICNTVNPLYNDIRYNSKIRYDVNLVSTKNQWIVYFSIEIPMLFFRKTYVLCIC